MSDMGKEFASLLYTILIVDEVKTVKQVAGHLGLKEQSLYSRLYGRVRFSVEEARAILTYVNDVRIADYFLDGSPYVAVGRVPESEQMAAEGVRTQTSSTLFDVADLMREVETSLCDDGRIDHREKARIQKRLMEAERSLSSLRRTLQDV